MYSFRVKNIQPGCYNSNISISIIYYIILYYIIFNIYLYT